MVEFEQRRSEEKSGISNARRVILSDQEYVKNSSKISKPLLRRVCRRFFRNLFGLSITYLGTSNGNDDVANVQKFINSKGTYPSVDGQIYKADFEDKTTPASIVETGVFKDNFSSKFTNFKDGDPKEPLTITISYDGTVPLPNLFYATLKTGPQFDVYLVNNWLGEDIVLTSRNRKAVSHGSLFGGPGTSVPDGGTTAALLGLGVLGLAGLRRKS